MCTSIAQGGQRCVSHAQPRLAKAGLTLQNAIHAGDVLSESRDLAAIRAATRAILRARADFFARLTDYASTPQGRQKLDKLARDPTTSLANARLYASALDEGHQVRTAASEQAAVRRGEFHRAVPISVIPAVRLPQLGWYSPRGQVFDPVKVAPPHENVSSSANIKPLGGVWTSPVHRQSTLWQNWAEREGLVVAGQESTDLFVRPSAKVALITSVSDYGQLQGRFPAAGDSKIAWQRLARHVHAVWITSTAIREAKQCNHPLEFYDVESVFWLNASVLTTKLPAP